MGARKAVAAAITAKLLKQPEQAFLVRHRIALLAMPENG